MKCKIRGIKTNTTKSINDYIIEKLSRMDKYFEKPDKIEAKVVFETRGKDQKVEVTIPYKNFQLRAEDASEDVYSAVDVVVDKLQRQFRKYKTKLIDKKRREEINNDIEELYEEEINKIVKRKSVFLKPMDEEEAIVQLNLLDHSFFVFKDVADNKIKILYRRKDGDFGIIDTE